ncbi:NLR family CARD domain-containing protein 3-like isoform X4 [Girardinichthys multiradiatus]|uniref:NLR family CARD domain-containing protein 3-like isoform X4 n=1 Tax=Girardinichthys multiradiatus TaxID=208333 RepID=UPI001FAD27B0|nr:NLR family CARD domain-containing protein 3-like isoform X4 [Girardinichthys multiradiatus]
MSRRIYLLLPVLVSSTLFCIFTVFPRKNCERRHTSDSCSVSMKSDHSAGHPLNFKRADSLDESFRDSPKNIPERKRSSDTTSVSLKSDQSARHPLNFKDGRDASETRSFPERMDTSVLSSVSLKSNRSMDHPINIKAGLDEQRTETLSDQSANQNPSELVLIFKELEKNIVKFVKSELKKFQTFLHPDPTQHLQSGKKDEEVLQGVDEDQRRSSKEAFLNITMSFLKSMKQEQLADLLYSKMFAPLYINKLKSNLKKRFQCVFEGIAKAGSPTLLNQIYTELYITEGGTGEVNDEHEVRQIETASRKPHRPETTIRQEDIFKVPPGRDQPIRTVMTKGVAGIGKTILTQKFTLDWAEDKAHQNIQVIFPFTFRELNVLKEKKFSLVELVHHFFTETKEICSFEQFLVLFIFDGLDESRLPLDFHNKEILTDVTESTSVDVLLTNLISGNLLPSALLWITTRPAAANQIPPECVGMVTEVRGFTDPQKEEYFRKRFRDEEQASRIISHMKTSRSLHIMCHIPVFCWITATVLEDVLKTREGGELPNTLTEMFIHFLVVQTKVKKVKYDGGSETDPHWSPESRKMIESLGKLAFDQLQKGNLIFYESDLTECGIDIRAASVYSGMFTQIFKEERGLYQDKVFCFVHLSVQEFLAALHVHLNIFKSEVNLPEEQKKTFKTSKTRKGVSPVGNFYQTAVDEALQSPNGHLDLFLRFLLGFSLETNKKLLKGLQWIGSNSLPNQEAAKYIKKKIEMNPSPERCINLFHCLNELKDNSLVEEIQQYLKSGNLSGQKLSPAQWSALVFILLSSEKDLEMFDLKKYSASEKSLLKLLPVLRTSNKALLDGCNLSERSCVALASILSSKSSKLRELDLSNNDLKDSGVKQLCSGLQSQCCKLESLRLSGCLITEEGFASLATALTSNPSHLKELDLSYNHPGEGGVKFLSAGLDNQHWRLETLRVDCGGEWTLQAGLRKYTYQLTMDSRTAHRNLKLSDNNRKTTVMTEEQPCTEDPERFDHWVQLLCAEALSGRHYWEVEWEGTVGIGVTYRGINRKGSQSSRLLGGNDKSWMLYCSKNDYFGFHNDERKYIPPPSIVSNRVGVYLDQPSGTLSFYRVSSDKLVHLHTFSTTFTEALYPAFRALQSSSISL